MLWLRIIAAWGELCLCLHRTSFMHHLRKRVQAMKWEIRRMGIRAYQMLASSDICTHLYLTAQFNVVRVYIQALQFTACNVEYNMTKC